MHWQMTLSTQWGSGSLAFPASCFTSASLSARLARCAPFESGLLGSDSDSESGDLERQGWVQELRDPHISDAGSLTTDSVVNAPHRTGEVDGGRPVAHVSGLPCSLRRDNDPPLAGDST